MVALTIWMINLRLIHGSESQVNGCGLSLNPSSEMWLVGSFCFSWLSNVDPLPHVLNSCMSNVYLAPNHGAILGPLWKPAESASSGRCWDRQFFCVFMENSTSPYELRFISRNTFQGRSTEKLINGPLRWAKGQHKAIIVSLWSVRILEL